VEATSFTLVDRHHESRATIRIGDEGDVAFCLFSPDGDLEAVLGTRPKANEPFLALYDGKSDKLQARAFMNLTNGAGVLSLRDKTGKHTFGSP
jgi:hypothetical protein